MQVISGDVLSFNWYEATVKCEKFISTSPFKLTNC